MKGGEGLKDEKGKNDNGDIIERAGWGIIKFCILRLSLLALTIINIVLFVLTTVRLVIL